jgi:hypothetical protein
VFKHLTPDSRIRSAGSRPRARAVSVGMGIVFQIGRARFAARGTTLKSTALARPEARSIVLSAGPRHGPIFAGPISGPIIIVHLPYKC